MLICAPTLKNADWPSIQLQLNLNLYSTSASTLSQPMGTYSVKKSLFSVIHLFWHNFWILQFSHWIECKQGLYIDYLLIKLICCMFLTIYKLESCVLAWLGSKLLTFLWKCGLFFLQTAFSGYCSMEGGEIQILSWVLRVVGP